MLPQEEEEGAAAEVRQHLLDQGLGGGAALGVGEHPLADPVQVLDHPLRGDPRRPDAPSSSAGGAGAFSGPGTTSSTSRVTPPSRISSSTSSEASRTLRPLTSSPLRRPQVLDPQLVAVVEQAGVLLRHARVGQTDVALGHSSR